MELVALKRINRKFPQTKLIDFDKHYPAYFSLTIEAKRSLAASLDVPLSSMKRWMEAKRGREKEIAIRTRQYLTTYEQHSKNVSGKYIYVYIYIYIYLPLYFYLLLHYPSPSPPLPLPLSAPFLPFPTSSPVL